MWRGTRITKRIKSFEELYIEGLPHFNLESTILQYFKTPTIEKATNVLDALQIHVPFRELSKTWKYSITLQPHRDPPKPKPNPSISKNYDILNRVDFVYDTITNKTVFYECNLRELILQDIPNTIYSNNVKDYLNKMQEESYYSYNEEFSSFVVAKIVASELNVMFGLYPTYGLQSGKISNDVQLHQLMTNWTRKPIAHIVLDGILRVDNDIFHSCPHYEDDMLNTQVDELRMIAFGAFLTVLFGSWQTFADRGFSSKQIVFYTGVFHSFRTKKYNKWFQRWIAELQKEMSCRISYHLFHRNTKNMYRDVSARCKRIHTHEDQPDGIHPLRTTYSGVVIERHHIILPDGTRVPKRKNGKLNTLELCVDQLKNNLYRISHRFDRQNPTIQDTPGIDVFLDHIVQVNAFRDQYKADMAIKLDAIYITIDRLSLIYYTMRALELGRINRGVFFGFPGTKSIHMVEYK